MKEKTTTTCHSKLETYSMPQVLRGEAPGCEPLLKRRELFDKYVEELNAIDPSTADRRTQITPYFDKCLESTRNFDLLTSKPKIPTAHWVDLYPEGRYGIAPVGFLLVSVDPEITGDANYCIQEAYVLPEYRNRGIMTTAINSVIHLAPHSSVRLHVLKANKNAKAFWTHTFERKGFLTYAKDCKKEGFWDLISKPNGRQQLKDM